jgi:hypothetical protein
VNRTAIDDLLCGIVSGWYESVADWTPPGQTSGATCAACGDTLLARVIDMRMWPHDLMHQFAAELESAAVQILDVRQEYGTTDAAAGLEEVRAHIAETVARQTDDILDVLEQCVTPRLDDYVGRRLARGLALVAAQPRG